MAPGRTLPCLPPGFPHVTQLILKQHLKDQSDNTAGRKLVLHKDDPVLIPSIPYGSQHHKE